MESIIHEIIGKEDILIILAIAFSVIVISVVKAVTGMIGRLAGERTRREVAAYIAEGSMTPEQGEKLLASSKQNNGCGSCG